MLPSSIRSKLQPESANWLISALDPFHDFEHPIEGAPDHVAGKSITREFKQSTTVSATADDDNISIFFSGCDGVDGVQQFCAWGNDSKPDAWANPASIAPIEVLRSATGNTPSYNSMAIAVPTTTSLAKFSTRQLNTIPGRLVAIGLEVTDVTPSLYRKGTLMVCHSAGEVQRGTVAVGVVEEDDLTVYESFQVPPVVTKQDRAAQIPGTYVGPLSKGAYVQGRLVEVQPPRNTALSYPSLGTVKGCHLDHPILQETATTEGRVYRMQPVADSGVPFTQEEFYDRTCFCYSGFEPFSILMTGVSEYTTLQVTVTSIVEYFPSPANPFEAGLATYSPPYDPLAFRMYHDALRALPMAVPVGFNAAGDYWRMASKVLSRVGGAVVSQLPRVADIAGIAATAMGQPELAAISRMAGVAVKAAQGQAQRRNKKKKATKPKGKR
jgi:hypothetical protein